MGNVQAAVNLWPLIGVAVMVAGFVLRANPMLVVVGSNFISKDFKEYLEQFAVDAVSLSHCRQHPQFSHGLLSNLLRRGVLQFAGSAARARASAANRLA